MEAEGGEAEPVHQGTVGGSARKGRKNLKQRTLYLYDDHDIARDRRKTLSRQRGTLALFVAGVLIAPVQYFMLVAGGPVPLAWIMGTTLQGIVAGLPKVTMEAFFMIGILIAHVLILGVLLYGAAWLICRILYLFFSPRAAGYSLAALTMTIAASSFLDIYSLPGHNASPSANLAGVFAATF